MAFKINKLVNSQSLALDFVFDNNQPKIVELSYGFIAKVYDECEGYWDEELNWNEGKEFDFCGWMVDELINK